ncbi:MAG: putative Fe-S protein YdhL (DUF1289 family) [Paracoccaceae bacterium]|jgi:predicted Fe-S protein YdhL (DUF1289 family)
MTDTVQSPCVSVCALDEADLCTGCFRTLREISDWSEYSNQKKREVVTEARERMVEYFQLG